MQLGPIENIGIDERYDRYYELPRVERRAMVNYDCCVKEDFDLDLEPGDVDINAVVTITWKLADAVKS